MRVQPRSLVACLVLISAHGVAAEPYLESVTPAEGAALIHKLQDLQRQLTRGEKPPVVLQSGGPVGLSIASVSPRDAFVRAPFHNVETISPAYNVVAGFRGYTMGLPYEPGKVWCTISVRTWAHDGKISNVEMECGPPPPGTPAPPAGG